MHLEGCASSDQAWPNCACACTNESERILANLGKNGRIRIWANLGKKWANLGEFWQQMGKNGQKTGERNRILAKQGETESFAETLFGFGHPWCPFNYFPLN